jgi:23S rRNA (cytosine1962-C5)-methyltransferase
LENSINELLQDVAKILEPNNHFLILNVYSLGLSALVVQNLIESNFKQTKNLDFGELYLQGKSGIQLPLGIVGRYSLL